MTIVGQAGRHKRGEDVAPRMTETTVPKWGPEGSNQGMCSWQTKRVQRAGAIAPDDHVLRQKILHRTTSRVKLNRIIVINGKLAYRDQILNKLRRNQNIIKT